MPWGRAGLDVVVTTDGDRDVFLVFVGASTGLGWKVYPGFPIGLPWVPVFSPVFVRFPHIKWSPVEHGHSPRSVLRQAQPWESQAALLLSGSDCHTDVRTESSTHVARPHNQGRYKGLPGERAFADGIGDAARFLCRGCRVAYAAASLWMSTVHPLSQTITS